MKNITKSLIKIAEQLDQKGRIEEANMIDKILATAATEETKSKEDIMVEIKFQIELINKYLGSIEHSIEIGGQPSDRTGDIQWHLTKLKEAFEELRELEDNEKAIAEREEEERQDMQFEEKWGAK